MNKFPSVSKEEGLLRNGASNFEGSTVKYKAKEKSFVFEEVSS